MSDALAHLRRRNTGELKAFASIYLENKRKKKLTWFSLKMFLWNTSHPGNTCSHMTCSWHCSWVSPGSVLPVKHLPTLIKKKNKTLQVKHCCMKMSSPNYSLFLLANAPAVKPCSPPLILCNISLRTVTVPFKHKTCSSLAQEWCCST